MNKKLLRSLRRQKNRKLSYDRVRSIFFDLIGDGLTVNEREEELLGILQMLDQEGKVKLPRGNSYYDISSGLKRPKFVTVVEQRKQVSKAWKDHIWTPQLSWVAGLTRIKEDTYQDFAIIDNYLREENDRRPLPEKERSIMLFGDEKRLRDLHYRYNDRADLFELTETYRTYEPLIYREYDTSSEIGLIIENRDTFDSCCRLNEKYKIYWIIVYGNGLNILTNRSYLELEDLDATQYHYFGDIDPTGLYIGQQLKQKCGEMGISIQLSGMSYYEKLIEIYEHQEYVFVAKIQKQEYSLDFLEEPRRKKVGELLDKEQRIPQELLNKWELEKIFRAFTID